jgi:GntR family transcriptional regulator
VREQLEAMGYETSTELLGIGREGPSVMVREKLRLHEGQDVYAIHRVHSVQGEPISLHHSYVPAHLAPDLDQHDTVNEQLCVVLETNFSLAMKHVQENLEAVSVTTEESRLLQMRKVMSDCVATLTSSQPVLLLEDLISDVRGTPFEYSSIVFRGDKISLRFDYKF